MTQPPRRKFNPKLHVLSARDYEARGEQLEEMGKTAVYIGSPKHKKCPGDFGLTPPVAPRPLASLCDSIEIFQKAIAQDLLCQAFRNGLIDARTPPGEWPQTVWMVWEDIHVVQGMGSGREGIYHGFPVTPSDPVCQEVLEIWKERQ